MKDDRDIERLLEEWLDEEARPMPAYILEAVLEAVPRASRMRPGGGWWQALTLRRWLAVGLVGAAIVVGVVMAPLLLQALQPPDDGTVGGSPTPSVTPVPSPTPGQVWNPALEWLNAPDHRNPSPDSYGNDAVWIYGYSDRSIGDTFWVLTPFTSYAGKWHVPGTSLGISGPVVDQVVMHPTGNETVFRDAVLGWQSPIAGRVTVSWHIVGDRGCWELSDGVDFSVAQRGFALYSAYVAPRTADDSTLTTDVELADPLYFVVHAKGHEDCDSMFLRLTIARQ